MTPPKILLIHHNAHNLGDVAIVEATIAQVRKQFPGCTMTLESSDPESSKEKFPNIHIIPRLFTVGGIQHTGKILSFDFFIKNIPFLLRTLRAYLASLFFVWFKPKYSSYEILNEYKKADLILSVAGDSISPDYAYFLRFHEISLIHKLKKPLILYAQSIGPFEGRLRQQAKKYLSKTTAIFARDEKTYNLMHEYGVKTNIYRTADTVISLEAQENDTTSSVIKEYGLDKNIVGIVIRTFKYSNYTKEEYKRYLDGMHVIIKYLDEKKLQPLFIASIPEDAEAARELAKQYSLNIQTLTLFKYMPSEVKTILSTIKLVISPRMHPIILASTMGIPVLGIGREFKLKDYLTMIGLEQYIVKMVPFDTEKTLQVLNELLTKYDQTQQDLIKNLSSAVDLSNKNAEYLTKIS